MNSFGKVDLIKEAWGILKKNANLFALLVGVYLIYYILQSIFTGKNVGYAAFPFSFLFYITSLVLGLGSINLVLHVIDKKKAEIKDLYTYPDLPMKVLKNFVASILVSLAVVGGLILLIIPGIYVGIRLSFVTYYILDKDAGIFDALKMSWNLTKGGVTNLFFFFILIGLLNIGGALLIGLGLFLTIPTSYIAVNLLYRKFQK